jgi:hypothetical protein
MKNLAVGFLFFIVLIGGYAGLLMLFWWLGWKSFPLLLVFVLGLRSYVGNERRHA